MKKSLQTIGALFFLLVFLYGNTGMSVLRHHCNSSGQTTITIFPDFHSQSDGGCCAMESSGRACENPDYITKGHEPQQIDEAPCCLNIVSYYKLEIVSERVQKQVLPILRVIQPLFQPILQSEMVDNIVFAIPAYYQVHSPHITGRMLLCFLHQIKIPSEPSLS